MGAETRHDIMKTCHHATILHLLHIVPMLWQKTFGYFWVHPRRIFSLWVFQLQLTFRIIYDFWLWNFVAYLQNSSFYRRHLFTWVSSWYTSLILERYHTTRVLGTFTFLHYVLCFIMSQLYLDQHNKVRQRVWLLRARANIYTFDMFVLHKFQ